MRPLLRRRRAPPPASPPTQSAAAATGARARFAQPDLDSPAVELEIRRPGRSSAVATSGPGRSSAVAASGPGRSSAGHLALLRSPLDSTPRLFK
jgi:hypothetical protein